MARRTDAERLQEWFNRDLVGIFKHHHAFDRAGLFIGDGTYLFVPDNDNYEGSAACSSMNTIIRSTVRR
jgi:hypothetical protein